jgi:formate/nitrite transporter FocA (FNT family)
MLRNWVLVFAGNFVGTLVVVGKLIDLSGVVGSDE